MKLISMKLHNFRQFFGTSPEIRFASGEKNVTVLFGTNGGGKTGLLNAFTWALYDSTTKGFLFPDQIVNKSAIRQAKPGDTVVGWVELKFDHLGKKYLLRKCQTALRVASEADTKQNIESSRTLQWAGEDGKWRSDDNVTDIVGRILPHDLHTYFFFDGERIERLVQPTQQERSDIANATKKLLGIEVLERAIRHVTSGRKILERDLEAIGDPETVQLLKEKGEIEGAVDAQTKRISELERNVEGHKARKEELEKRLRAHHAVKAVQTRRDQLNQDHDGRGTALAQTNIDLANLIGNRAYAIFIEPASSAYKSLIDGLRQRGELPAGIKRQFVDDLLEEQMCICKRSLAQSDVAARIAVEDWKAKAGLADVEEKAIRMGGEVKQLEMGIQEFWALLNRYEQKRATERSELARIENELESISEQLKNSPREEVSGLEAQLKEAESTIERDLLEKGSLQASIKLKLFRLSEIDRELLRHQANEAKQQLAQRRVIAANEVISRLNESWELFESGLRKRLRQKVSRLFDTISYTPYVPEIAEDYSLMLLESAGGSPLPVAASQGESQILSLCFIGAIIELAREYHAQKEKLPGPDSSEYPLVMDSPFGSLGPTYRRQVADHISILADQVVIMVTDTQWRNEVEHAVKERLGASYILEYYSPKEQLSREIIEVNGCSFDLIKQSPSDYEYTKVLEIDHA